MPAALSEKARSLHTGTVVWDAHACLPLAPGQSMAELERHRASGATFVSVNVGMDFNPIPQVMRVIAGFRAWLAEHSAHFLQAMTAEDARRAKREGKLAAAFDLEGSATLDAAGTILRLYPHRGVRRLHL